MERNAAERKTGAQRQPSLSAAEQTYHGRIFSAPDQDKCLDAVQLHRLEQAFRDWTAAALRADVRVSRRRILLIFLLIRYTAAKLSEVLNLDPLEDIDYAHQVVRFGRLQADSGRPPRIVQISEALCQEIQAILTEVSSPNDAPPALTVDPGFVRRKFYERAEACGLLKQLGAPEILRKSRAVELMQNNMPLPAVQMLLGHSTPNLTSAYVSFSADDIQQVTRIFMEKESARKTSARNTFFGKIQTIRKGDIQAFVELLTIDGHRIATIITNESLRRLGLKVGALISAEVKAPWVMLQKRDHSLHCSADNILDGTVVRINPGKINTEFLVQLSGGTEVCALVTTESYRRLCLAEGEPVWVFFNSSAVVLMVE